MTLFSASTADWWEYCDNFIYVSDDSGVAGDAVVGRNVDDSAAAVTQACPEDGQGVVLQDWPAAAAAAAVEVKLCMIPTASHHLQ